MHPVYEDKTKQVTAEATWSAQEEKVLAEMRENIGKLEGRRARALAYRQAKLAGVMEKVFKEANGLAGANHPSPPYNERVIEAMAGHVSELRDVFNFLAAGQPSARDEELRLLRQLAANVQYLRACEHRPTDSAEFRMRMDSVGEAYRAWATFAARML